MHRLNRHNYSITNNNIMNHNDESQNFQILQLSLSKEEWEERPLFFRVNLRIFSFLFPSVLKIILK
jgi:hypothetical protein